MKTPAFVEIGVSRKDLRAVMDGFHTLNWSVANKHMTKAIKETGSAFVPSLRSVTPRNRGALASAAGNDAKRPKRKVSRHKFEKTTAWGRLGYKKGKTKGGKQRAGHIAHFLEKGVSARFPRKRAFRIDWTKNRKYQYLKRFMNSSSEEQPDGSQKQMYLVFLRETKPVKGEGHFRKYLLKNRRPISRKLMRELSRGLKSAIAESSALSMSRSTARRK